MTLFINACVNKDSRTRRLAECLLSRLDGQYEEVKLHEIAFPVTDQAFLEQRDKLIACRYDGADEIAKVIGADSLGYLSVDAIHKIAGEADVCFCDGCFTGSYPIPVPENPAKNKYDTKIGDF